MIVCSEIEGGPSNMTFLRSIMSYNSFLYGYHNICIRSFMIE